MSWFEGIISGLLGAGGVQQLSGTAATLFGFFDTVTNGKMWRSLGWLLLGLALTGVGLSLWLKSEVM